MNLIIAELEPLLIEEGLTLDLKTSFASFQTGERLPSTLTFINYLHKQDQLQEDVYLRLLAQLSVELTGLDLLNPYYDQTQLIDRRQQLQAVHSESSGQEQATTRRLGNLKQGASYQLLKQIGAGAMGSIHLAKDHFLRRQVAFKKLLPGLATAEVIERFLAEVQITAQLDHPNVIPIYTLDADESGAPAYSMKVVKGISMKEWLAQIRRSYDQGEVPEAHQLPARLAIFLKICDALELAHQRGVIHRDLKPANIMLGEYNEVYVMDWGIAKTFALPETDSLELDSDLATKVSLDSTSYLDHEIGQIVGTPRYMSPEQAGGKNHLLDQRSDIFAMGLILFEVICLKQALIGKDMPEILAKVIRGHFEPFASAYAEAISPALKAIVSKANPRRRVDRYQSMGELAEDLRRYLRDQPVLAHQESLLFKSLRLMHLYRTSLALVLILLVVLSACLSAGLIYNNQVRLQAARERQLVFGQIQSALANQAQLMTAQLMRQEALLRELSGITQVALERGLSAKKKPAFIIQMDSDPNLPADFAVYSGFSQARSFTEPLYLLPETHSASVDKSLLSLAPIAGDLQRLLLSAVSPAAIALVPEQKRMQLSAPTNPVDHFLVTLGNGLHLRYPGVMLPADTQPLQDPVYRLGSQAYEPIWASSSPDQKFLSCSLGLFEPNGLSLGMAGIQVKRRETLGVLLSLPHQVPNSSFYLLNAEAEVLESEPLAASALLTDTQQKRLRSSFAEASGYFDDQGNLFAFTRLGRAELYLVFRAKWSDLLASHVN